MSIKAIGFELDGVLYDRKFLYSKIFLEAQKNIKRLDVSFDDFYFMLRRQSNIEYEAFFKGVKSKKDYKINRIIQTYKFFGKEISLEEAQKINDYYKIFREEIKLTEKAVYLLEYLKEDRYKIFILTNGSYEDQLLKMKILGLDKFIPEDRWYISEGIGFSKPDKEAFSFIEEQLDTQAKKIMYIGENLRNDIIGPARLNWTTLFYGMKNSYEFRTVGPTIHDLLEVKEYL